MLTTSYYAKLKKIQKPVAISVGVPKWYSGADYDTLAPPYTIVSAYKRGIISDEVFTSEFYKSVLSKLNPLNVYNDIISRFGDDATLICYEKPGDFCHRRLVAKWFEDNLNIEVPELIF